MAITSTPAMESVTAADQLAALLETALCLSAVAELVAEDDLCIEELALRIQQYSDCAAGIYCPEVAFDPVAIRLRTLASRHNGNQTDARWSVSIRQALAELFGQCRKKNAAPAEPELNRAAAA